MRAERYKQQSKEFVIPEQTIELEKIFELIYPGLPPEVIDVTQKVLVTEIETLSKKGIRTAWVRSGARQLAILLAEEYGVAEELSKRWKIFDPRYRNRPELTRKQLAALDPKNYSSLPDMDIKAFTDNPWVDVDEEIGRTMSDSVQSQLGKPDDNNITYSDDRSRATWGYPTANNSGTISAEFGKIPGTQRVNSAITYRTNEAHEAFGMQIAGMGNVTEELHADNRNPVSNYSNETFALELRVVDDKVVVDLSGMRRWYNGLSQQIKVDRDIKYDQQREAMLALRSGRIFVHMLPQTENLPALLSEYYDENSLIKMRNAFRDLKVTDKEVASTLRREFTAMMGCDPYAAFVWSIETGADKYFFGRGATQKLLNALFSDAMTLETMGAFDFERTRLLPALRTPKRLAAQRNIFLDGKSSGLSIARNALTNTFKSGAVTPEEFDELTDSISWKSDFTQEVDLKRYYELFLEETVRQFYLKTISARPTSQLWFENMKRIWLKLADTAKTDGLVIKECLESIWNDIDSDAVRFNSIKNVINNYLTDLQNIGLITNWDDKFFITPDFILNPLCVNNWSAGLSEDQFHALQLQTVVRAHNAILEYQRKFKPSKNNQLNSSDDIWLKKAFYFVQDYGTAHFINILAFIRQFPNDPSVGRRVAHFNGSKDTPALVESENYKEAQRLIKESSQK